MSFGHSLLERHAVYRLWQAPFAADKLGPLLARNNLSRVRRVLDVGCGPGINAHLFANADYLGIDINPRYIAYARKKFQRHFIVADATTYEVPPDQSFDLIFVNSFFHHVETPAVRRILSHLRTLLTPDGHVHIIDLVLPPRPSLALFLTRMDRGKFPRPLEECRMLFAEAYDLVEFEPYTLKAFGLTCWDMVYCKGRAKP